MYVDYNVSSDNEKMSILEPERMFAQAFQMLMMTSQGDIQYYPTEGIQLENFLFDTNVKNSDIGNHLSNQLEHYASVEGLNWSIDDIKIVELEDGDDCCLIEYSVGDKSSIMEVVR